MLDERLIQEIVQEVVKRIPFATPEQKSKLFAVVNEKNGSISREIDVLSKHWTVEVLDQKQEMDLSQLERVVFLDVDQDTLARMAIGLTDTFQSKLFADLLSTSEGEIFLRFDQQLEQLLNDQSRKRKYSAYRKHFMNYKQTIESFGVEIVKLEDVKPSSAKEQTTSSKKLITRDDIRSFQDKTLYVKQGTIITPLAKDLAKERGIEILYS